MFNRRWMAVLMAGALALGLTSARAESVAAEYLVNMAPEDVLRLEQRLSALGYLAGEADQVYDVDTRQAVERFQQANGLDVTGQVDEATNAVLNSTSALSREAFLRGFIQAYQEMEPLKSGDINNQVQNVQLKLNEYGYFNYNADGVFGEATRLAVERFQMVNGLPVTGRVDGMTMMRLMAEVPITWKGYISEMSCAPGDVGLNVYVLQKKLDAMGFFEGECTGSYGDLTQAAVEGFQQDNGLEVTGLADAAVWERIYSGQAVARRRADVLERGDSGDQVATAQQRLNALGYYLPEVSASFDFATETAVRLFQMANELNVTGKVGSDTLSALLSQTALPLSDANVQQRFVAMLSERSADVQARISEIATHMVGQRFHAQDVALYPGYALVQYVCVAAGLPITSPEAVIRLADDPVESAAEVGPGNIMAFQTAGSDSVTMMLTIGAGEGRVIYATPDTGWVVMGYMNQFDSESVYRWAESAP